MDEVVGIIVGFALTTVIGGWWAAKLQERSWVRQNDVRLREAENERAGAACAEITSLLDRRLYRMRRILWAAADGVDQEDMERRLADYREVLFAWNDRLNTNLSLIGSHFGDRARDYLDGLYEDFKRVGQDVEEVVRAVRTDSGASLTAARAAAELDGREVGSLNDRVYKFGLLLMGQLRDGRVGRYAPDSSTSRSTTAP